jgi:hypothetical protein
MDLYDAIDWLAANVQNGGNYTIVLGKDQAITPTEFFYPNKTVSITLKCAGGKRKVAFEGKSPAYSLFTIRDGVTFTLEEGITLEGAQNNADKSLVRVAGGAFVMNGGVYVTGAFIKSGGVIYGYTAPEAGKPNMAQDDSRGHTVAIGNDRGQISKKRNTTAMDSGNRPIYRDRSIKEGF